MPLSGASEFALRLGLGAVPAALEEVVVEIGDRLDAYQPRVREGTTGIDLSLTVVARDVCGSPCCWQWPP